MNSFSSEYMLSCLCKKSTHHGRVCAMRWVKGEYFRQTRGTTSPRWKDQILGKGLCDATCALCPIGEYMAQSIPKGQLHLRAISEDARRHEQNRGKRGGKLSKMKMEMQQHLRKMELSHDSF